MTPLAEAMELDDAARLLGVVLFVDTDHRLKCYGVELLNRNPELRARIICNHAAIRDLIVSRSL